MTNPFDIYRKTDVMTAGRETLLLMMYAGAMRFLRQGIAALEGGDYPEMTRMIGKTQEIVNELRSTLNFEVGGEIARSLERLYAIVTQKLIQANLEKTATPLGEALGILENLNTAWEQAIASLKQERASAEK